MLVLKKVFLTCFFYFLLKFPAYDKTRYFIAQTKLPEVVKFSEASEESAFPLGKGLVGPADEFFSMAEGTSNKILDAGSEYVVSAITLPSETEESVDRKMELVKNVLYYKKRHNPLFTCMVRL